MFMDDGRQTSPDLMNSLFLAVLTETYGIKCAKVFFSEEMPSKDLFDG